MKMQYKRVLTESIQETLIYYINGRRFRANAIREGKNIYKINGADRYILSDNLKTPLKKDIEFTELDIGIEGYSVTANILKDVGEISNLMISVVHQSLLSIFDGHIEDKSVNIYLEINVGYKVQGRIFNIVRSRVMPDANEKRVLYEIIACAREIAMQYKDILGKKLININANHYDIILSAGTGGILIHEGIGHNLEADIFYKDGSLLNQKIGKKIFDKRINIIDRCDKEDFINYNFSADGSESKKVHLVRNGVIEKVMSDKFTSLYYQIPDTGNGRIATFENRVIPRMRNTFLDNGNISSTNIIDSMSYGIIALELGGGSVDVSTGDFVLHVALGGLVKNGEIIALVPQYIIRGNVLTTLNCIKEIGNDLKFKYAKCIKDGQEIKVSYGCPTIKLENQEIFC